MLASFMSSHGWDFKSLKVPENLAGLIQTDSRKAGPGQWFVPIVGETHDAHDFIEKACALGASGFLYARDRAGKIKPELLSRGIAVDDTYKAMQDLAKWWRAEHKNCLVIGITGSSGKTSVKELCAEMLKSLAPTLKTAGSLNNELGVPLTLLQMTDEHKFAVIEMGARHKGDIAFLTNIVQQNVGVLINVGTAHVGEFGGREAVLTAKMEIAQADHSVYFRDDERIHESMLKKAKQRLSFGRHPEADVRIVKDSCDAQGQLHIELSIKGQIKSFVLPYFHEVYGLNVACVLAIAESLGLPIDACIKGLKAYNGIKGRFQVHRMESYTLIDDAYNANPQSMRAGLETLKKAYPDKRKVLILGDMRELGEETEHAHREIGAYCAKDIKPELLVSVGESSQWMHEAAKANGLGADRLLHYASVEDVLPKLKDLVKRGDLLYVKASNGLKLFKIIDTLLAT
ncbi:MAG: UDP-N-acetylmuramoyl-tripeptide--D-alanyl-D-alanine ligase [Proteobacteria bacterium]|nr:MAG: UDP-N-acetylmuramoyl-tripeptide--D-alanyl-D-alanine ligase [Pseudomonadota bacterium]